MQTTGDHSSKVSSWTRRDAVLEWVLRNSFGSSKKSFLPSIVKRSITAPLPTPNSLWVEGALLEIPRGFGPGDFLLYRIPAKTSSRCQWEILETRCKHWRQAL